MGGGGGVRKSRKGRGEGGAHFANIFLDFFHNTQ